MRIGVISEGHADRAVILNVIKGLTGLDDSDIKAILPIRSLDETDKSRLKDKEEFGGWTSVKRECESGNLIDEFLAIEGQDFVVIHLDTAEAHEYGIDRPSKNDVEYVSKLRTLVIDKIHDWLKDVDSSKILHAIAVEEIDAWILTIYEKRNSSIPYKAKERLRRILSSKDIDSTSDFDNFLKLSKPFINSKIVSRGSFLSYNQSLKEFSKEVSEKITSKLNNNND